MAGFVGIGSAIPTGVARAVGPQGPPGPVGPPGASVAAFTAVAVGTVSQYQTIAQVAGVPVIADASNPAHAGKVIGVAATTATNGNSFDIQYSGMLVNSGWNWNVDLPVYLGANGQLTQTPPTAGFAQIIGVPVNPTTLLIQMQPPIVIAA